VADANPEPRTIDKQMHQSIRGELPKAKVLELPQSRGQGRVIRDREIQLEQLGQRPEEALGLAKRKMTVPRSNKL